MKRTKEIWRSMWKRCGGLNGKGAGAKKYKNIVFVCDRWRSFDNFISDMGLAPDGYSLDRKDNSKNYDRDNCRWSTAKTQTRNRTITKTVEYQGKIWFIQDLADFLGIRYDTLWRRLKAGWDVDSLGQKPNRGSGSIRRRSRIISYKGVEYPLSELSSLLNIPPETLWSRRQRGWSDADLSKPVG